MYISFFQFPTQQSTQKHTRRYSVIVDRDADAATMHTAAVDGLIKELGLKDTDRHLLEGHIEYRDAEPGLTIIKEGCAEVSFFDSILHV